MKGGALFAACGLLLAACTGGGSGSRPEGRGGEAASLQQAFVAAVERAVPAVVNLRTVSRFPRQGGQRPRTEGQDLQDYIAGILEENGGFRENALGSGVILGEDGLIVTNEHVVRDADEIVARLSDGTEHRARIVGTDPRTDIALLRIEPARKLPVAALGDSSRLRVGQWAIAVGNPFGLESTVTVGVISAMGRTDVGDEGSDEFIQTDASINPGNSGGPLLNTRGEVIGINTAMVSAGQGIGFAIPINTVKSIEGDLVRDGSVRRGWLGVGIQPLTAELAESFAAKGEKGLLVNRVFPGSPAESAGLRDGDILIGLAGKAVAGVREFQRQIAAVRPGSAVELDIVRDGRRLRATASLGEAPGEAPRPNARKEPVDAWGLSVADVPRRLLRELSLRGGVEVGYVEGSGPAWKGGIKEGDIILRIGREPVSSAASYRKAIARLPKGRSVSVLIYRDGAQVYVAVRTR
ncbi:MAG: Do family serine endopeptidase [Deltaproteobacteria bacterium]|nr:Do family serine endopeptidase [Deltaproteobacteria bacterium]